MGAQLHTINVQLPDDHIEYIVNDAADEILFVDPGEEFRTIEQLWDRLESVESVVVMDDDVPETDFSRVMAYEELIADHDADAS